MNKNPVQKVVENRQEIIRTGSENNVDTTQTEVTETTETFGENGSTVTTVKRKVVTVTQGHEKVIEDSQMILDDMNDMALKSVVDGGFVVVETEEHHSSEHTATVNENVHENGELFVNRLYLITCTNHTRKSSSSSKLSTL